VSKVNLAKGRIATVPTHVPPSKVPLPVLILDPSTSWFLGSTWVSPQTASRSFQQFLHSSPVRLSHRHATSVAIGHIYAPCAGNAAYNTIHTCTHVAVIIKHLKHI